MSATHFQVNLFNDTMYENVIEVYNSEFVEESLLVGRINSESSLRDLKRFYVSGPLYDTVTVRMKASPGYRDYGFVAEVVTIPISGLWRPNVGRHVFHVLRSLKPLFLHKLLIKSNNFSVEINK